MQRVWIATSLLLLATMASVARAQPVVQATNSARDCATCHLDWVDSFQKPKAILLMDVPPKPVVAEEETCLGCHDGAVGDERRDVWLEHGHKTNSKPPEGMAIPKNLPLADGKVACKTCHTAHAIPGQARNISEVIFLRVPNDKSQLCQSCHTESPKGPGHGTHPLGAILKNPPSPELAAAGGKVGPDNHTVICQSCHRPHGSREDHLLVKGTSSSELCITCHTDKQPGMFRPDQPKHHPQNPPLKTAEQRQAIKDMGTHIGKGDTLVCLSCHRLHDGKAGRFILADSLTESQLCIRCHSDRATVFGSKHDLRKTAPEEKNCLEQTPQQSGPCGACHSFHSFTRQPLAQKSDPTGVCLTCHATGKVAEKSGGTSMAHPAEVALRNIPAGAKLAFHTDKNDPNKKSVICLTCHNPHETVKPKFLRETRDELCGSCHVTQQQNLAGDHDFSKNAQAKNGRGHTAAEVGRCGFCHDVHHSNGPAMWAGTKDIPTGPDELCMQCHRESGLAAKKPAFQFSHVTGPRTAATTRPSEALPLFDASAHRSPDGFVTCASCHDPHQSKEKARSLLRVTTATSTLCLQCHTEKRQLAQGPHDAGAARKPWPAQQVTHTEDTCMGCHRAHSNDPKRKLFTVVPAPGGNGTDGVCMGCHTNQQWAPSEPVAAANAAAPSTEPSPEPTREQMKAELEAALRGLSSPNAQGAGGTGNGLTAAGQIATGRMLHPTNLPSGSALAAAAHALPLEMARSSPGAHATADVIGCKTCHDPHARRGTPRLLRVPGPDRPAQDLCLTCHRDNATVAHSMHSEPQMLANAVAAAPAPDGAANADVTNPVKISACGPCHAVHAVPTSTRSKLWASALAPGLEVTIEQRCLGCHGPIGTARRPELFQHPQTAMKSMRLSTTRPTAALSPETTGQVAVITCDTCHVPHGSEITGIDHFAENGRIPVTLLAAAKPMLRPDVPENLCATCHGPDAQRVFLYFHHSNKRSEVRKLLGQ